MLSNIKQEQDTILCFAFTFPVITSQHSRSSEACEFDLTTTFFLRGIVFGRRFGT